MFRHISDRIRQRGSALKGEREPVLEVDPFREERLKFAGAKLGERALKQAKPMDELTVRDIYSSPEVEAICMEEGYESVKVGQGNKLDNDVSVLREVSFSHPDGRILSIITNKCITPLGHSMRMNPRLEFFDQESHQKHIEKYEIAFSQEQPLRQIVENS